MPQIHVRVSDHAELAAVDVTVADDAPLGALLPIFAEGLGKDPSKSFAGVALQRDATGAALDLKRSLREHGVKAGELLVWNWHSTKSEVDDWLLGGDDASSREDDAELDTVRQSAEPAVREVAESPSLPLAPLPEPNRPIEPVPKRPALPIERANVEGGGSSTGSAPANASTDSANPGREKKKRTAPRADANASAQDGETRRPKPTPSFTGWLVRGGSFEWSPSITPLFLRRFARVGLIAGMATSLVAITESPFQCALQLSLTLALWLSGEGLAAILESTTRGDDPP